MISRISDAHCHLHEFSDSDISLISMLNIDVIAVSDDYSSSVRTLTIAKKYKWVIPAIGLHPWSIKINSIEEANNVSELALNKDNNIRVLGEIGIDKRFKPETFTYQLQIFKLFIDIAKEINAVLNVHAAGAWEEVLTLLTRSDIPTAIIHWYTGPKELLKDIVDRGLYITINPTVIIQQKHREIARSAPLDIILVESDAPYIYRGMPLHPKNVFDVISYIANIRNMNTEELCHIISNNYIKLKQKYLGI